MIQISPFFHCRKFIKPSVTNNCTCFTNFQAFSLIFNQCTSRRMEEKKNAQKIPVKRKNTKQWLFPFLYSTSFFFHVTYCFVDTFEFKNGTWKLTGVWRGENLEKIVKFLKNFELSIKFDNWKQLKIENCFKNLNFHSFPLFDSNFPVYNKVSITFLPTLVFNFHLVNTIN